ncbi:hypothetical protein QFC21_007133 [Naganishia friedmannii]|uniref:Uncharacterized protein n=1 Tax=Naganishia friedmannii TaxID=89922 RepID=A0ACC2UX62_9TREE|nr:hypothetical protein QFC21_007133 [Naganishia friedmannii]
MSAHPLQTLEGLRTLANRILGTDHEFGESENQATLEKNLESRDYGRPADYLATRKASDDMNLRDYTESFRSTSDALINGLPDTLITLWLKPQRNLLRLFAREMKASCYGRLGRTPLTREEAEKLIVALEQRVRFIGEVMDKGNTDGAIDQQSWRALTSFSSNGTYSSVTPSFVIGEESGCQDISTTKCRACVFCAQLLTGRISALPATLPPDLNWLRDAKVAINSSGNESHTISDIMDRSISPIRGKVNKYDESINDIRDQYVKLICCLVYISERSSALQRIVAGLRNELLVLCQPSARETFNKILGHCCKLMDITTTALHQFHDSLGQLKVIAETRGRCVKFTRCFDHHTSDRLKSLLTHIANFREQVSRIRETLEIYSDEVVNAAMSAFGILSADIIQIQSMSHLKGLVVPLPFISTSTYQPISSTAAIEAPPHIAIDVAVPHRITLIANATGSQSSSLSSESSLLQQPTGAPILFSSSHSLSADLTSALADTQSVWVDTAPTLSERQSASPPAWPEEGLIDTRPALRTAAQPNENAPNDARPFNPREISLFNNFNRANIDIKVVTERRDESIRPVQATIDPIVTYAAAALHACCTNRAVRDSYAEGVLGDMEISTQATPMFAANGLSTKWSSTVFASVTQNSDARTRIAILVFAIDGPVTGGDLQNAVAKSILPSTVKYPVGLLSSQIAKIVSEDLPATVVVTGKGLYGNLAESILYEALDAVTPVLSMQQTLPVRFAVVGFSPVRLLMNPRPSTAVLSLFKNSFSASAGDEQVKRLQIHHVYHELDPLDRSLRLLNYTENDLALRYPGLSLCESGYRLLEEAISHANPPHGYTYGAIKEPLIERIIRQAPSINKFALSANMDRESSTTHLRNLDALRSQTTLPSNRCLQAFAKIGNKQDGNTQFETTVWDATFITEIAPAGTLEACLLIASTGDFRVSLIPRLRPGPLGIVTRASVGRLLTEQQPIFPERLRCVILCNRRDKQDTAEQIGRPARVLITGTSLGLFRADDFSIQFSMKDDQYAEPVPLWDKDRVSRHGPGFIRPQFFSGADGVTAGVEFEDIAGIGVLARNDSTPTLRVKIRSNDNEEVSERPTGETDLSWTSDGTASGIQPMDLVATSICKSALELVALGLCASNTPFSLQLFRNHPRALKVTNALIDLSLQLGLKQEFTYVYQKLLTETDATETFANILGQPLLIKMAEQLQEKADQHRVRIAVAVHPNETWLNFVERTGVYIWHQSSVAWNRVLTMAGLGGTTRQKVSKSYLHLRDVIRDASRVADRNLLVLEDIEEACVGASLDESRQDLLGPAVAEIVKPMLQLRRACNKLVIITIIGQQDAGKTLAIQNMTQLKFHQRVKMKSGEGPKGRTVSPEVIGIFPQAVTESNAAMAHDVIFVGLPGAIETVPIEPLPLFKNYLPCVQTAADMTLLFASQPAGPPGKIEPLYRFADMLETTGESTEILLVGTGYSKGQQDYGTAVRDKVAKREELSNVVVPEQRKRIRRIFCLDQKSDPLDWDLDRLADVRAEITDFLRRRTEGGTLEKMLNSTPIPEYRAFDFRRGGLADEEDEEEQKPGPFVHEVRRHTTKHYFKLLSSKWILTHDDYTRMNAVEMLLREMNTLGLLSERSAAAVRSSNVLADDHRFLRENTVDADCVKLQAIFADLAATEV